MSQGMGINRRKVSVIMPAFNCETYIKEALQSAIDQTERDIEIIVVNDGSTDDTLARIEDVGSVDPRLRVSSQRHSGRCGVARNTALSHARGELVSLLGADDIYHPEKIGREPAVVESFPDVDLVCSNM